MFMYLLNELMIRPYPLLECDVPLTKYHNTQPISRLRLTSFGNDILNGKRNHLGLLKLDWWIGGEYFKENKWNWDGKSLSNNAEQ